jgi:DNA-binding NarL/FixJ family response regulator
MAEKIRVVICDDEDTYRKAIQKTLGMASDIDVVAVCRDGQEGFDACMAEVPDVLLTDVNMPRVSGLELTKRILQREREIRVVILTVREDDDTIFEALRAGAMGYLLKTSTAQDVIEGVRLAFRDETKLTPKVATKVIEDFRRFEPSATTKTEAADHLLMLSDREQQILNCVAEGMRNREIATKLGIAEKTVKNHVSNILKALQVNSRTEAAMRAVKAKG